MKLSESILDKACKTEGEDYNTGLKIKEFEVWATPPHRYRHCTEFYLRYPHPFPYEVKEQEEPNLPQQWNIGFYTPDGKWHSSWIGINSREGAEWGIKNWTNGYAYATCRVNFFYTKTGIADGSFCDKEEGIPVGVVLQDERTWTAFQQVTISQEEARIILEFQETVQKFWKERAKSWRKKEAERVEAVARAVASEDLPSTNNLLECFECGATYNEPGHVDFGGMCCDKCR